MKRIKIQVAAGLVLGVLLSGCAGYGNPPNAEWGDAVAEMEERQTAFPDRVVKDGSPQLDGPIAARVVRTYRADTGDRDAVKNSIEVNIGQ